MVELLVFGVDGQNPEITQKFIDDMPNFKKLQRDSVYGELESYACDGYQVPHTGPMWTSIYTGLKPEEHGLLSGGWNDGDSEFHKMFTVWDEISEKTDKEMVLYGMPMTYKAREIQGEMVSGFVSPTLKSMFGNCLYPEDEMLEKLPEDFIEYTSSYSAKVKADGAKPSADSKSFFQTISGTERERINVFTEIYNDTDADLVAYGTTLVDKIGHVDGVTEEGEYAKKCYELLDEILGDLLEALEPEHVIVVSDHGFHEYEHTMEGYFLDTTGRGMSDVFDFTPTLLDFFGLEYDEEKYGPDKTRKERLSENEKDDIKEQLQNMGYM